MYKEKINNNTIFSSLKHKVWPNVYLHKSHPTDFARTEHLTFVCYPNREDAVPNNNWMDPKEAKEMLTKLTDGCMRDRAMYVVPYIIGYPDSRYSKICVQITDNSYVAVSIKIMTRMGKIALEKLGNRDNFVKGIHSIGDLELNKRFIMHLPDENLV